MSVDDDDTIQLLEPADLPGRGRPAAEQLFFHAMPVAHVVAYEIHARARRLSRHETGRKAWKLS